jgi:hypothetical protein
MLHSAQALIQVEGVQLNTTRKGGGISHDPRPLTRELDGDNIHGAPTLAGGV